MSVWFVTWKVLVFFISLASSLIAQTFFFWDVMNGFDGGYKYEINLGLCTP